MLYILLLFSCLSINSYPLHYYTATPQKTFALGKPYSTGKWKMPPLIKICKELNISQTRIQIAIAYWKNSGYDFHDIIFDYDSIECLGDYYRSDIIITTVDQSIEENHLASTRTSVNIKTGYILKAKIFIREKDINRPRVLEHELGHALGWKHYPQYLHIMHPEWESGGYHNNGVKKTEQKENYGIFK